MSNEMDSSFKHSAKLQARADWGNHSRPTGSHHLTSPGEVFPFSACLLFDTFCSAGCGL